MLALTKQQQKDLQRLEQLRPIDDDFMRCLFKDNIPLAELVLRILTGKQDLMITACETQKDMKRLAGARSVCLDAYGVDSDRKSTIQKYKGLTKALSHTGRDTIPVYLISRTCILVRRLRSYQIRTRFLLRRKIFSAWENQSIRLNGLILQQGHFLRMGNACRWDSGA